MFINPRFKKGEIKIAGNKKIYSKKEGTISDFEVWIVNGEYIRKNICEDFVNLGQHYALKFIPKNEFWISKEVVPGEEWFYIAYLLTENRLMAKGMTHKKASEIADKAEKRERRKSVTLQKIKKIRTKDGLLKKVRKKIIRKYENGIDVWLVRGELVRDAFYIDFAGGGHDKVYHFIPNKEIWIDDDIVKEEREFIILHELHERNLMAKRWNYPKAHRSATGVEDFCRRHPKKTGGFIKAEVKLPITASCGASKY